MVLKTSRQRRSRGPLSPTPALDAAAAAAAAVAAAEAVRTRDRSNSAEPPPPVEFRPIRRAMVQQADPGGRPQPTRISTIRIALVAVMGTCLALLGARAFDRSVPALLLPAPIVAAVAALVRRRAVNVRVAAEFAAVMVTTFATGALVTDDLGALITDAIDGPRRLITTEWPSPLDAGVATTIALVVALATAIAADLAGRQRFHLSPLAPIGVGFAAMMAMAAPVSPVRWVLAILAAAAVVLLLARPGDEPRTRVRVLAGERSLAASLAGLVAAMVVTSSAIAWSDRSDPRQDVQADVTLALLDPVEQMAALRAVDPPIDMFRITDRSALIGPSLPTRWRTSALSEYDGQRWLPALTLRPIGNTLGRPPASGTETAPPIAFDLEVLTDDISLIPLPGAPLSVDAGDIHIATDAKRTVVHLDTLPDPGAVVHVESEVAPTAAVASPDLIAPRQVDEIATSFLSDAEDIGGQGTVLDRLRAIEGEMRGWDLDENAPGAGQQLKLIDRFVTETQRGTRAQFVTAFVLLARSLGVDARVATGFLVPPDELTTPISLRSDFATVWAEVQLRGLGWLAFDPVPPEEAPIDDQKPPPPSAQSPAAAQPPLDPPPDRDESDDEPENDDAAEATDGGVATWVVRSTIAGTAVVLPIVIVLGTILGAKWRRRRRRLRDTDPARRIVGAWANATDSLVDAGLAINPSWTDEKIAEHATAVAPDIPLDVHRLALSATAMTFGAADAGEAQAADAVGTAMSIDRAIRADRSRWQRIRWHLSVRSLRRSTRSPVTI